MNQKAKKSAGDSLLYVTLPILVLLIWEGAALAGQLKPYTMPEPKVIVATTIQMLRSGELLQNIGVSIFLVLEGFFLALLVAFVIGLFVSLFPKFELFTDMVIQIIKPIPPIAWIPLAILWFGIGQNSKIYIIFIGAVFPVIWGVRWWL